MKNIMLGFFEKIWATEPKVEESEIREVHKWLADNKFPVCLLPNDYLDFLKESNGGNFTNKDREFQFLSALEVLEFYEAYIFAEFMPYAFPFAMDGCGNFYLFNMRWKDRGGE